MDMESLMGSLIIQIGFFSVIAYVPLQIYAGIKWSGGWRIAALVPLLLMVPVFVFTAVAFAQESNLWPIVLIFAAPLGTIYLIFLFIMRRFATGRPNALDADRRAGPSDRPDDGSGLGNPQRLTTG